MQLLYHGTSANLFGFFLPTSASFNSEEFFPVHTKLRAKLNVRVARLYDLLRDKLRYFLDPKEATGAPDFPSDSFRDLQYNELASFGESRHRSLVLDAFEQDCH